MLRKLVPFILGIFLYSSCCNEEVHENDMPNAIEPSHVLAFADTIIYDVIIKNTNPDDYWTEECLKNIDRESFINDLFENIYNGELDAFHYLTGEKIAAKPLKILESDADYSRESIGKIQFAEIWYYDASSQVFDKRVISVILGAEQFDQEGKLKGYKPLFKVYLN